MTTEAKEYLLQMQYLQIEINQLEDSINDLSVNGYEYGVDGVTGSSKEIPYAKHNILVAGYSRSDGAQAQIKKLGDIYREKLERLYEGRREAEKLLDSIKDSKARIIIRYRYIDGMEWQDIANKLGGSNTEASVKMYSKRILENL